MGVKVAQVVPAASRPLRHCVCLAFGSGTALWTLAVYPRVNSSKRTFACACWLVGLNVRQFKRKLFFWNRNGSAVWTVNKRDWFAPVPLAAKYPVTKLVVYGFLANALLGKPFNHLVDCILLVKTVKEFRVNVNSVFRPSLALNVNFAL